MSFWSLFRSMLLMVASLGYLANGAQAHLHVTNGDRLEVMLCGSGASQTVSLEIPGEPAQETDTCCGDCVPGAALEPPVKIELVSVLRFSQPVPAHLPLAVSPRSPLWPGAPPQGPPRLSV